MNNTEIKEEVVKEKKKVGRKKKEGVRPYTNRSVVSVHESIKDMLDLYQETTGTSLRFFVNTTLERELKAEFNKLGIQLPAGKI